MNTGFITSLCNIEQNVFEWALAQASVHKSADSMWPEGRIWAVGSARAFSTGMKGNPKYRFETLFNHVRSFQAAGAFGQPPLRFGFPPAAAV